MKRDFLIRGIDLPDWARWYAVDGDGRVHAYECEPYMSLTGDIWFATGRFYELGIRFNVPLPFDWTQTLHKIERAG